MFCQTSHDPKKGLWMLKITQFFYFTFFWGGEGECISFSHRVITLCLRPVVFTREVVFCRTLDAFSVCIIQKYYQEIPLETYLYEINNPRREKHFFFKFCIQVLAKTGIVSITICHSVVSDYINTMKTTFLKVLIVNKLFSY